jgi:hypothetical protein
MRDATVWTAFRPEEVEMKLHIAGVIDFVPDGCCGGWFGLGLKWYTRPKQEQQKTEQDCHCRFCAKPFHTSHSTLSMLPIRRAVH